MSFFRHLSQSAFYMMVINTLSIKRHNQHMILLTLRITDCMMNTRLFQAEVELAMNDNNSKSAENSAQKDVIDYVKQAKLNITKMVSDPSVDYNRKRNVLTIDTGPAVVIVKLKSDNSAQDNAVAESTSTGTGTAVNKTQARREPITQREAEIKKLRDEGLTQREVAKIMGTTQANISKIERAMKNRAKEQEAQKHAAKAGSVDTTTTAPSSTVQ